MNDSVWMTWCGQVSVDGWLWLGECTWVDAAGLVQNKLTWPTEPMENSVPHLKKDQPLMCQPMGCRDGDNLQ